MTRALVAGLESSSTFAEAKSITSLLETTPYWEAGFDDRVRGAVRDNRQVSEAFGVPERIEALIAKQTPL